MKSQTPSNKPFSLTDLKLYVYGSRQSDQFWLPNSNSHSRKPFCLTDVENFPINNEDSDDDNSKEEDLQQPSSQPIPNPLYNQPIYKIACGSIHSVVLTIDGRVFTFGCNDEGALGRKGTQCIPIQVTLEDPIDMIAAGDNHSLFANSANGAIYFTGNYNYKRGEKMTDSIFEPTKIFASEISPYNKNKRIQKMACGANHSCILIDKKIFCRGEPQASTTGRRISKRHKVENSLTFNGVNLNDVVDIQCGGYHTVAKREKNGEFSYYSWGTNDHGQLGINSFESQPFPTEIRKLRGKNINKIAAGSAFTLFLSAEGELYGCGNNQDSNLGLGEDFKLSEQELQSEEVDDDKNKQENPLQSKMAQLSINKVEISKDQQAQNKESQMQNQIKADEPRPSEKKARSKSEVIKKVVSIDLPQNPTDIVAGENFGFAWNKKSLYTWGMGYGYVLLNGQENDETEPFKVKQKIINNHSIHALDAGNQHVLYTSYPNNIEGQVKIEPKSSVWQKLSIAKNGLKRRK